MRHATNAYNTVRRASMVEGKSPHELTLMLFDGALDALSQARLQSGEREQCRQSLNKAIAITQELQGTLKDPDTVEVAGNLFRLYGFIIDQLLAASRSSSATEIDDAEEILLALREAWSDIEPLRAAA